MTREEFLVKLKDIGLYGESFVDPQETDEYIGVDIFNSGIGGEILATIYDVATFCIQTYPAWMEAKANDNRDKKFKLFYDYMSTPTNER